MSTLTVTTKGQITVKQELLKHLGVRPGQQISVDKLPDGRAILQAERAENTDMDTVFGILKPKNTQQITLSIDEMNHITPHGGREKYEPSDTIFVTRPAAGRLPAAA